MKIHAVSVLLAGSMLMGCASTGSNQAPKGALVGSLLGAGLGAIIGHQSGEAAAGAAIGAGVGAAGGYVVGNEQDKSEAYNQSVQDKAQWQAANAQAIEAANTVVINVANSNGSITPVTLRRQGSEYIGPKGEHYIQLPTPEQLKPVYGF